jgi:hypothetical protein
MPSKTFISSFQVMDIEESMNTFFERENALIVSEFAG